jgi:hypothetical protein
MMRSRVIALFLLLTCSLVLFFMNSGFGQQGVGEEQRSTKEKKEVATQAETEEEKLIPSPKNIKEGTAIYVFVGWMWLSIFVLIYILRLKIKEIDRLYKIKFFSTKRE